MFSASRRCLVFSTMASRSSFAYCFLLPVDAAWFIHIYCQHHHDMAWTYSYTVLDTCFAGIFETSLCSTSLQTGHSETRYSECIAVLLNDVTLLCACLSVCTHDIVDVSFTTFSVPDTLKCRVTRCEVDGTCQSTAQVRPPYMCCAHDVVTEQNPTLT